MLGIRWTMGKLTWQQVALILAGILLGGGVITYVDLFGALFELKGINYTHSGDIICGETCESYINVTTTYWRICFAHYNGTKYENETTLFKKRSRSRTLHVDLSRVDNIISTEPRVEVDWLVPTYGKKWRPIKDGDCWDRLKTNKIKLVGHKEKSQTVKWNFNTGDFVEIDPIWKGIKEKKIEYGATWDRSCDGGTCNMLLYSGVRNADENGTRIENAKSLKTCQFCDSIILSIKEDKKYPVKIIDYNYTSITLNVQADTLELNKDIPLKVYSTKIVYDEKTQEYIENKTTHFETTAKLTSISDKQSFTIPFGFGKVVKWGENSTTITLQTNESENLDDDDIVSAGNAIAIFVDDADSGSYGDAYVKFNISFIPVSATINEAINCHYSGDAGLNNDANDISLGYGISNWTWNEEIGVDTTMRTTQGVNYDNVTEITALGWYCFNFTNFTKDVFEGGYKNITFGFFLCDPNCVSDSGDDYYTFRTKENANVTTRPYLNVTYTEAPPPPVTNCTPANKDTNWRWNMSNCCNITTGVDLGEGNITTDLGVATECGVWNVSANINVTNMTITQGTVWCTTANCLINITG